jgi:poly(3-hydroxybutyrate) depolymerase
MSKSSHLFYSIALLFGSHLVGLASELESGSYAINQDWSQEQDYERSYFVHVPESVEPLPLFIFLHGNGGNAERSMQGFTRRYKDLCKRYNMVFAQGYLKSWNIVSNRSQAPDREFIEAIVTELAEYSNVKASGAVLMGSSNGAALVNQFAIETRSDHFSHYITVVSQLNAWQHDGTAFKAKGVDNNYTESVVPLKGKCLMNVSGVDDRLVPYSGGSSRAIRAKSGKLAFVDAEKSTYLWAQHYGYTGEQLSQPSESSEAMDTYSYLDGTVIHYKMKTRGHNAGGGLTEAMLLKFLDQSN